jgi:uncharacterized protein YigE (DUF2233 family)
MGRVIAALIVWLAVAGAAAAKAPCESRTFEGDRFTVCAYDPRTDKIGMAWQDAAGMRLLGFPGLKAFLGARADRVHFAMNAGMYRITGHPAGLYVSGGVQEKALNRQKGPGNFHLMPNGVFWIDAQGRAHVETSDAFANARVRPVLATQSGPMLLIAGRLHPRFQDDGPSRLIRNGVGERAGGGAAFVISDTPVSFGKLARFFRDELAIRDALFLDGSVSSLWEPARGRMDVFAPLGPMMWVEARSD